MAGCQRSRVSFDELIPETMLVRALAPRRARAAWELRRLLSTANEGLKAWEAKASKEAKGADPYQAFGSSTIDVSDSLRHHHRVS